MIARDASSPAPVGVSTIGPTTTASFTPPPESLLMAVCTVGNSSGSGARTGTVTDSLGSTWTLKDSYSSATGNPWVGIFMMDAGPSPAARTVSLTGVGGANAKGLRLTVYALTGALPAATALGNVAHASTQTVNLTISTARSMAYCAAGDNGASAALGVAANNTLITAIGDGTNGESYAHARSTLFELPTGVFVAGFFGGTAQNSLAAWEIKAGAPPLANAYWGIKNTLSSTGRVGQARVGAARVGEG